MELERPEGDTDGRIVLPFVEVGRAKRIGIGGDGGGGSK